MFPVSNEDEQKNSNTNYEVVPCIHKIKIFGQKDYEQYFLHGTFFSFLFSRELSDYLYFILLISTHIQENWDSEKSEIYHEITTN